jgi:hypothetical protein
MHRKQYDNYCSDVGRNSQPVRWATESDTPTWRLDIKTVKRGVMGTSCKPDASTPLAGSHDEAMNLCLNHRKGKQAYAGEQA